MEFKNIRFHLQSKRKQVQVLSMLALRKCVLFSKRFGIFITMLDMTTLRMCMNILQLMLTKFFSIQMSEKDKE